MRVDDELDGLGGDRGNRRADLRCQRRVLVVDQEDGVAADRETKIAACARHHVDALGELLGGDLDFAEVGLRRGRRNRAERHAGSERAARHRTQERSPGPVIAASWHTGASVWKHCRGT